MTFGRRRRPDDWSTSHARARAALSDRLDGVLEPGEASWLDEHLAECVDCRRAAEAYEAQRLQLRAGRDHAPLPPRDLWARTAAAIEHESRFRDHRARSGGGIGRRPLAISSALVAALVVTVVVGTLISSQLPPGGGHATPNPSGVTTAAGSAGSTTAQSAVPGATPIVVAQRVDYVKKGQDGLYRVTRLDVRSVCPKASNSCDTAAPTPAQEPGVQLTTTPQTVFGNPDRTQLIVVNEADQTQAASISVVPLPSSTPDASPPPSESSAPTLSGEASPTPSEPSPTPSETSSATPSIAPTESVGSSGPPPSIPVTPSSTPGGPVEIAENVVLVGQSAAYSTNGDWFAFTARPADGSAGPDIYVWKVGDPAARAVTSDHRSSFGSWVDETMAVGSSVVETPRSNGQEPDRASVSFLIDPVTGRQLPLPQTGRTWLPSVDPSGQRAVYWTGSLRLKADAPVYLPKAGRLVIGDWSPAAAAASDEPASTPLSGDQSAARHETTIAAGQLDDWDARWESTGRKLAVWIADPENPHLGVLSLYAVDPFDGRIDLKKPLLDKTPATAGFSISDGKLVWAEPAADGSGTGGRILVLAWTDQGAGTVETVPDQVLVIR